MEFEVPNRWVIVRAERTGLWLRLSAWDDRGRARSARGLPARIENSEGLRRVLFQMPPGIVELVAEGLADLPERRLDSFEADRLVTLPLFCRLGPGLAEEADLLEPELPEVLATRVRTVLLPPRRSARRSPFRLPLGVLALGMRPTVWDGLRGAGWYTEIMQEHGLRLEAVPGDSGAEVLRNLPWETVTAPWDVVTAPVWMLPELLSIEADLPLSGARPRIIVILAESTEIEAWRRSVRELLPGMSLLWIAGSESWNGFEELLYGLIHDLPLHDAVGEAQRAVGGDVRMILAADPWSNQDLRLSQAVAGIADEMALLNVSTVGDVGDFLRRHRVSLSRDEANGIDRAWNLEVSARQRLGYAANFESNFGRESKGLTALAWAEQGLAEARSLRQRAVRQIELSPRLIEQLRQHQERRVDVAIQTLESVPVRTLPPQYSLRSDGLYRLRVHVGHRLEGSLMVGEPPPLDPLLPAESRGHTLHVVVYEKDFSALSARVQSLWLPDLGGSQPVYFDLRAPDRRGPARLRLKVFYRNQLLQSFLLTAEVSQREEPWPEPGPALRVELAYSRSTRFTNLKDFKPRALSIGVNQNPGGDSHQFMFKVGKSAEAIDVSEMLLSQQIQRFREILADASEDAQEKPRFATYPEPGQPPSEAFFQVLRELAEVGGALYDALFVRMSPKLKERMRKLARRADETVQLVRDDPKYVFPWTILYDFGRPQRRTGEAPPPVCMGFVPGEPARPCAHGPGDDVYCVNGFWGIRHVLEVLLARSGELEDEIPAVERSARAAAVCLAVQGDDSIAKQFAVDLAQKLGSAVLVPREEDDLLDLLWDPARRPALLVVLGHLETREIDGEPVGPRIVLVPKKKWFLIDPVTRREQRDGGWQQPRTVVLLMACGSGATEVSTLNDFVTALASAGAAAVVGTECLVFTLLVTRFSKEITTDLWQGNITLGEAVKAFRRRLIEVGNPLGFVFTSAGNADLVFQLKG